MTAKEEKYCRWYVKLGNKKEAAINAGYSKKTAGEQGYQLYEKPHIKARIIEIEKKVFEELEITTFKLFSEIKGIAFTSVSDILESWDKFKNLDILTHEQKAAIAEVSVVNTQFGENVKIKMHDKLKAIDKLLEIKLRELSETKDDTTESDNLPPVNIFRKRRASNDK